MPPESVFEIPEGHTDTNFKIFLQILLQMRQRGAPILPTLEQQIQQMEYEQESKRLSDQKSAPARSQAILLSLMIFVFGVSLFFMVPEIQSELGIWVFVVLVAQVLSLLGTFWILRLADEATRAGLTYTEWSENQGFLVWMNTLEALIASGVSPDRAWLEALDLVESETQGRLRLFLPSSPWFRSSEQSASPHRLHSIIVGLSQSIQVALMEGRPCLERIQSQAKDFRAQLRFLVLQELELLQTRTLKPLFLTLFPAMMILMLGMMLIVLGKEQWL
jgi:hypothetical protein